MELIYSVGLLGYALQCWRLKNTEITQIHLSQLITHDHLNKLGGKQSEKKPIFFLKKSRDN